MLLSINTHKRDIQNDVALSQMISDHPSYIASKCIERQHKVLNSVTVWRWVTGIFLFWHSPRTRIETDMLLKNEHDIFQYL